MIDEINNKYLELAKEIHENNPVVLAHLDLAPELYFRHKAGQFNILKTYYLYEFKQAGVNIIVSSLYIAEEYIPDMALKMALLFYDALLEEIETVKEDVFFIKSKKELQEVVTKNKIGIMLSFEGVEPLGNHIDLLRPFYQLGVRGMGLTWSRRNHFASGCCRGSQLFDIAGGISGEGIELIKMAEDMGIWVDVSHLNDEGFQELSEIAERPFIASHSNVRSICMNYRNLTDSQLKKIAERGGMIGINAYKNMISADLSSNEAVVNQLCRHIEYIIMDIGYENVGLGLDLCARYYEVEPAGSVKQIRYQGDSLADHTDIITIAATLLSRGVSEQHVKSVVGNNFYNYFNKIIK